MTTDSHPTDLNEILLLCWQLLQRGCTDRRFGFHHPVVSTVDANGLPKSRVVILREVNDAKNTVRFNADIRTKKWDELLAKPAISMALYDKPEKTQLRLEGTAILHNGNDMAKQAWDASQPMSRVGYCSVLAPGQVISGPEVVDLAGSVEDSQAGFTNFGTIEIELQNIEWLYLKAGGNLRAFFNLSANTSQWLAP
jgi:pyridoxamine 5'-phosphate oxidase